MALFTVTIGSDTFEVYAGLTAVSTAINGMRTAAAQSFRDLSTDDLKRTLVDVTSYLDRQNWKGVADALGGTTLQFPRTGLVDASGATVGDAAQLAIVAKAVGQLCALAAANPNVLAAADTSQNIRRADAGGGTGVEFFNPTAVRLGTATPLPTAVQLLLGRWLASSGTGKGGSGDTGCGCSDFASTSRLDRSGPF